MSLFSAAMAAPAITMHDDIAVIRCQGRMVVGELQALEAAKAAVERTGKVVLDLEDLKFLDSTGLGTLARLCVSARRRSGDVKLVAPPPAIREVLAVTMLGRVFEVFPTLDLALAAFAQQPRGKRRGRAGKAT